MELARVIGSVVATAKHSALVGIRLVVLLPQDANGNVTGEAMVGADPLQSGVGDVVSWIGGREAALALPITYTPVDCAVVSIVDHSWSDGRHL